MEKNNLSENHISDKTSTTPSGEIKTTNNSSNNFMRPRRRKPAPKPILTNADTILKAEHSPTRPVKKTVPQPNVANKMVNKNLVPMPKKKPFNRGNKEQKLSIIPLGGLGEVGKNMTCIRYGNSIIVIDGGVMFPEEDLLGIDMVIPDYTYLLDNREMVKAFCMTHGHEDHIGAMPYILKDFNVPVYGSRLTLGLLNGKLQEHHITAKTFEVKPREKITIGEFQVEFIRVTHSIPDTMAIAVHTPVGIVLVMSDFKMDMSPVDGQLMDFGRIAGLGEEGVLLLLADSTNVEKSGFTPSEKTIGDSFNKIFMAAEGRIILTSFASNVHRIQQAIWSAEQCNRKVAIVGRGMHNVFTIASQLGYLSIPDDILIDIDDINRIQNNKVLILTTGSQGEPLSGLTRMASGDHKQVKILPGDLVVISASPIPGNEKLIGRTIDKLFRQGANVIHERGEGIHVSGHASQEELKVLQNLVKPKFFMPIHGEYRMLHKHSLLAQQTGVPAENVFVMENGQILTVSKTRCQISGTVPSGRILIDGLGIGDVGNAVLKERKQLSQDGVVVVNIVIDKTSGQIINGPEIYSKGFIFEKEYEHIIDEAREKVTAICTKYSSGNTMPDWNNLRIQIKNNLNRFLFDKTHRRPIILPVVVEI